jgi:hypothetical protein
MISVCIIILRRVGGDILMNICADNLWSIEERLGRRIKEGSGNGASLCEEFHDGELG